MAVSLGAWFRVPLEALPSSLGAARCASAVQSSPGPNQVAASLSFSALKYIEDLAPAFSCYGFTVATVGGVV
eukprot:scaffold98051_cov61-Phaeocystis_antarctica.AAC.2